MKDIIIVGAGPCGLVALKEMREAGHNATIFERSESLGGIFASPKIYPDLHLTISNRFMAFSGFPDPTRMHYSSAAEYLQYLHDYVRHFDLEKHIRYDSQVCEATRVDHSYWSLQVRCSGTLTSVEADALIVATGASQLPNMDVPELEGFHGRVIHSSQYGEDFKQYVTKNKARVLIIGAGESGADVSAELAELSPNITVWLRRPPCIASRYMDHSSPEMEQVLLNKTRNVPISRFLEVNTVSYIGSGLNVFLYGMFREFIFRLPGLNRVMTTFDLAHWASASLRADQATYAAKNMRMCEAITQDKLTVVVNSHMSASGRTCTFGSKHNGDASSRDFDVVVLCTGFRAAFPWLRLPKNTTFVNNPRTWFLHCFPEGMGHCLFFLGYARPAQGGIPPVAEMLSRYIAMMLRGKAALPPDYADLARRDMLAEREYYSVSPDLHTLIDYNAMMESVARRIGCEPRLPMRCVAIFNLHMLSVLCLALTCWKTGPLGFWEAAVMWAGTAAARFMMKDALLVKWIFYPHWPVWYRQRGPGANPRHLEDVLERSPVGEALEICPQFILFVVWHLPAFYVQHFLSFFVFGLYVLLKMLDLEHAYMPLGWLRPKLYVLHRCPWRLADLFHP